MAIKGVIKGFCKVTAAQVGSKVGERAYVNTCSTYSYYMVNGNENPEVAVANEEIEVKPTEQKPKTYLEMLSEWWEQAKTHITAKNTGAFFIGTLTAVGCGAIPVPGSLIGVVAYYGGSTMVVRAGKAVGERVGEFTGDNVVFPVYYTFYPKGSSESQIYSDAREPEQAGKFIEDKHAVLARLKEAQDKAEEASKAIKTSLQRANEDIVKTVDDSYTSALQSALQAIEHEQQQAKTLYAQYQFELQKEAEQKIEEQLLQGKSVYEKMKYYKEKAVAKSTLSV